MSDAKYTIVKKEFKGINVSNLIIENVDGKHKAVEITDVIKLARSGKIKNAQSILDTSSGEYILKIDEGLNSLTNYTRESSVHLELTARIIENNKCIGYKAVDNKGKSYRLTIEKVWSLAEQGSITGVCGKYKYGRKVILSTDNFKLSELPKLK